MDDSEMEVKAKRRDAKPPNARGRLQYINIRLQEIAEERARLVEERKALKANRRGTASAEDADSE